MSLNLYGGKKPRPSQIVLMDATERFICTAGNRYPGKTTAALWKAMKLCLDVPGTTGFIGRWFKTHLHSSTLAQWKDNFPLPAWGDVYSLDDDLEPNFIKFKNGSVIHCVALQHYETKLRGPNFSFGIIDQMEECPPEVWTQAVASVRVDPPGSHRFIIATVNKTRGWYWIRRRFKDKKDFQNKPLALDEAARYRLIENRWDENKEAVKNGYYRDLEANSTSKAQVEFDVYGRDPSEFGLVFPNFDRMANTKKFEFHELGPVSFYLGYDEGFDAPSAFLFVAITPDGTHWIRAEHYQARMTVRDHEAKLHEIANRIGFPLAPGLCRYVADSAIFGKRGGNGVTIAGEWGATNWPWESCGHKDPAASWEMMRSLMQPDSSGKVRFVVHTEDCPSFTEEIEEAYYNEDRVGEMLKRCKRHAIDSFSYLSAVARSPLAYVPPPKVDGSWTQFRQARPGKTSWLAPARREVPLFLPRYRQS